MAIFANYNMTKMKLKSRKQIMIITLVITFFIVMIPVFLSYFCHC